MEGNWRELDDGAEDSQEGRFNCGRPPNTSMRFLTWLYLTCVIALIGFVLGSVKLVLSHYTSQQPVPHVRMSSLRSTGLLIGGGLLLSGLGAFLVILANRFWPDSFPLRSRSDD
ncbi:hypothetical protein J2793_007244 [Paraburkholderia caledonica]|uniref:DUF202 domain-containing protein n=1 Tax=Paraburkholderia caledonica TaxID=134536 RepID=A0AB73IP66_9BURK|nr:hypothetical protein [Paraburkholderia caledonica]